MGILTGWGHGKGRPHEKLKYEDQRVAYDDAQEAQETRSEKSTHSNACRIM